MTAQDQLVKLLDAVRDLADDFDEGWGDHFQSGDFHNGGFSQVEHGQDHTRKEFNLIRAIREFDGDL